MGYPVLNGYDDLFYDSLFSSYFGPGSAPGVRIPRIAIPAE